MLSYFKYIRSSDGFELTEANWIIVLVAGNSRALSFSSPCIAPSLLLLLPRLLFLNRGRVVVGNKVEEAEAVFWFWSTQTEGRFYLKKETTDLLSTQQRVSSSDFLGRVSRFYPSELKPSKTPLNAVVFRKICPLSSNPPQVLCIHCCYILRQTHQYLENGWGKRQVEVGNAFEREPLP